MCTRSVAPFQSSFALTRISLLLQYVAPGALVAFDIDDTLIRKRHFSCQLVTADGVMALHSALNNEYRDAYSLAQRQSMINTLCHAVRDVVLAEDDTALVVKELQRRGARVFGLTARSPALSQATRDCLNQLGIDLSLTPPSSLPIQAEEEETGAVIEDGIVYCGDCDKGVVIDKLLTIGWLAWPAEATPNCLHISNVPNHSSSTSTSSSSSSSSTSTSSSSTSSSLSQSSSDMTSSDTENENKDTFNISSPSSSSSTGKCQRLLGRACSYHKHTEDGSLCPERALWFVDDNLTMILGAMKAWKEIENKYEINKKTLGPWASQVPCVGRISLVCCHYLHPTAAATATALHAAASATANTNTTTNTTNANTNTSMTATPNTNGGSNMGEGNETSNIPSSNSNPVTKADLIRCQMNMFIKHGIIVQDIETKKLILNIITEKDAIKSAGQTMMD